MHIPASSSLHTNQADEAFMRVGDKSRKLTFDERVQLMYDKGERSFEDTAVYGAEPILEVSSTRSFSCSE